MSGGASGIPFAGVITLGSLGSNAVAVGSAPIEVVVTTYPPDEAAVVVLGAGATTNMEVWNQMDEGLTPEDGGLMYCLVVDDSAGRTAVVGG